MVNCKCRDCREGRIGRKAARAPMFADYEQEVDGPNRTDASEDWRALYARKVYAPIERAMRAPYAPLAAWDIEELGPMEGLARLRRS